MFPLTAASVLDYFALSQFYDRTCTNEQLRMQTRFTAAAGGPAAPHTARLEDMVGTEYAVSRAAPPRLFVLHRRQRHGPAEAEVTASYYVLDGTVYQAPDLLSLLRCRLATSLTYLRDAVDMGSAGLQYEPRLKAYTAAGSTGAGLAPDTPAATVAQRSLAALHSLL